MAKKGKNSGKGKKLGPTDDPNIRSRGLDAALKQGKRFLDYPANEKYATEGKSSIPEYTRKRQHVEKASQKERDIINANYDDAKKRREGLELAKKSSSKSIAKDHTEKAIEANERIKSRDKLHGPGYARGGLVSKNSKRKPTGRKK